MAVGRGSGEGVGFVAVDIGEGRGLGVGLGVSVGPEVGTGVFVGGVVGLEVGPEVDREVAGIVTPSFDAGGRGATQPVGISEPNQSRAAKAPSHFSLFMRFSTPAGEGGVARSR